MTQKVSIRVRLIDQVRVMFKIPGVAYRILLGSEESKRLMLIGRFSVCVVEEHLPCFHRLHGRLNAVGARFKSRSGSLRYDASPPCCAGLYRECGFFNH